MQSMGGAAVEGQSIVEPDVSSHIVLESQDEEASSLRQPEHVAAQFSFDSRIRGTSVQLTLYEEGFLAVREKYRGKRDGERLLDLRYLDPKPRISRAIAKRMAYLALGSASLTALLASLGWLGIVPASAFPATLVFGVTTAIFVWLFLYRTTEQSTFHTANGRANVLALSATVGLIHAVRRAVPVLAAAISKAHVGGDNHLYLRQEMREHYRLVQSGIISEDDCSTCTRRILRQFG